MMERSKLTIGEKVRVVPPKYLGAPEKNQKEKVMYVRELHNAQTAGMSYRKNGKHIYGVLYSVLHPLNKG